MAIKVVTVKCPECGAALPVEEDRKQIFCEYCGAKIVLENDHEYVYRHIDEAEVKRAETERMLAEEKLRREREEREEKEAEEEQRVKRAKEKKEAHAKWEQEKNDAIGSGCLMVIIGAAIAILPIGIFDNTWIPLFFIGIIIGFIGFVNMMTAGTALATYGKICVPDSINEIETKNYAQIQSIFENAGFKNIKCIALNDLTVGLIKKPGTVASITINGESVTSGGSWFAPSASIVITYHSFSGK